MQAPTHFLVSILIYKLLAQTPLPIWLIWCLALLGAFLSHFVVDICAKITYHPPEAHWDSTFWIVYHVFIWGLTVFTFVYYFDPYFWAMFFGVLVDIIDWLVLRAILKKDPLFHPKIDEWRDKYLAKLPDWNYKPFSVIFEIILLVILFVAIQI